MNLTKRESTEATQNKRKPKSTHDDRSREPLRASIRAQPRDSGIPALDTIDMLLLEELQGNARIPYAELARRVHLSTPAVIDRVRRLEEAGVLLGYRAEVNPAALGLGVRAFVKVTVSGDRLTAFATLARSVPEILECHRVTGNESFLAQVAVRDMDHLEQVLDRLMPYVSTNTSIVLNSPVNRAALSLATAEHATQPAEAARRSPNVR